MRSIQWISAALLALAAVSSQARAEGVLGMPGVPGGYDWAAYGAPPCQAPFYGTYGSVVPGTYDCPSCCLNVWGGYCQKKAMRYEKLANSNCPACTGESPAVKQRCAAGSGCASCANRDLPADANCSTPANAPLSEPPAPPSPVPAKQ